MRTLWSMRHSILFFLSSIFVEKGVSKKKKNLVYLSWMHYVTLLRILLDKIIY